MKNIWLISDTHFNHEKILTFEQGGKSIRPFANVREMDQFIMDNWNETVKPGDTVIHCGDVLFGENKVTWMENNFTKLNGTKRLVLGNHDNPKFLAPFFKDIQLWINHENLIMTHVPLHESTIEERFRWDSKSDLPIVNVHGHLHSTPSPEGPYKCVCVEQIGFTPIHIEELV